MRHWVWFVAAAGVSIASVPRTAAACGGGLVSSVGASVGGNVQRIFISAGSSSTDVVTQIAVPQTSADYGVLIPLPAEPTIDPNPIDSTELDQLDEATRVRVFHSGGGESSGCACGGDSAKAGGARNANGVFVADPVAVGPVTAVALTGDTGAAVETWLSDNGFVIPSEHSALLGEYAGTGRWFIAVRRNNGAATGGESSIGLHFSLAGDQRGLPLRFARIGAAAKVSFVVFVAAAAPVGPASPFSALTVRDLAAAEVESDYSGAIERAVEMKGGAAFIVESVSSPDVLPFDSRIKQLASSAQKVTRLSTIVAAADLTQDVSFDGPAPADVPSTITVGLTRAASAVGPIAALLALLLLSGRPRRSSRDRAGR